MQRLLDRARSELIDFVEQDRQAVMMAVCADTDVAMTLAVLRDVDRSNQTDLFLLFADEFVDAQSYVSTVIERLRAECLLAAATVDGGSEETVLPPLPEELLDDGQPPEERIERSLAFIRSLLPKGHRLVFALLPTEIHDVHAYHLFVTASVPRQPLVTPSMAGRRLILRDVPEARGGRAAKWATMPFTRVSHFDFGPDALRFSLQEDVHDPSLPRELRMQAMLSLAIEDYGHERYAEAVAKYNVLLPHYQETGNLPMQALVLNGIGDIYHRKADLRSAEQWYESAVAPAVESNAAPVLLNIVKNLGAVAASQGLHVRAEVYYTQADRLAAATGDARAKVTVLEQRGIALEKQDRIQEAIEAWRSAADISRSAGMADSLQTNLVHLERVYERHQIRDQLVRVRAELRQLAEART